MNIFGKTLISVVLTAIMLASCSSGRSTPTLSDAEIMETAISTLSTTLAETQRALPIATSTPFPTDTPVPPIVTPTLSPTPTVVPGPTATPVFPPIERFVGIWLNVDSNTTSWGKIEIINNEGTLGVHFMLICYSEEWASLYPDGLVCYDTGASAKYSGNPVQMSSEEGSTKYRYTLSLDGDTLHVTTFMEYTGNSGSADETLEDDFRKGK
jgi:hypothetical protein